MAGPRIAQSSSCAQVIDSTKRSGISVLSELSFDQFVEICASIGEVLSIADVEIIPKSRRHVNSSAAVPPHSDGPQADLIAWYCVRQDEENGTSLLFDTSPILRSLSAEVRSELASVQLPYYDHTSAPGRPTGYAPMLRGHDEGSWRVNYAPWLVSGPLDAEQRDAISAFQSAIDSSTPIKIRLDRGECLVVDNWRILHSRDSVMPDSVRLLKRAWIRTTRHSDMPGDDT
jgi:hypothetical protein